MTEESKMGHNSELTDAERKALFMHHLQKCYAQFQECKQAQAELKRLHKVAKADGIATGRIKTGYDALEQEDQSLPGQKLMDELEILNWLGLPVSHQPDLFEAKAGDDSIRASGFSAGELGKPCESGFAKGSKEDENWRAAWREGQDEQLKNFQAAMEKKQAAENDDEDLSDAIPAEAAE